MISTLKTVTSRFIREEDGATMVEYVLLVALIGVIAITAMKTLGTAASTKLNGVAGNVTNGA